MAELQRFEGGCHCGKVRFAVLCPPEVEVEECNCSICSKVGFIHLIVPAAHFSLLSGKGELSEYTFNSGIAKHFFCRHCGVKPFYIPRSNPDGFSINVRCLDAPTPKLNIVPFDGQNWEANAAALSHKSKL